MKNGWNPDKNFDAKILVIRLSDKFHCIFGLSQFLRVLSLLVVHNACKKH